MTDNRNLFNRCLHLFRDLDNSWQGWVALHNTIEEIVEDALDLAIDQVVNLKLVQTICLFQLPGARATNNNLWSILPDYRMGDDLQEFMRIKWSQVLAENFGINVCCVRDAQRVVGMNGQHLRLWTHEFFQFTDVTSDDVFFRVFP